jgi:hypothetical protein
MRHTASYLHSWPERSVIASVSLVRLESVYQHDDLNLLKRNEIRAKTPQTPPSFPHAVLRSPLAKSVVR